MKVLILGGSGMLGHKLWQTCANRFDTFVTMRHAPTAYARYGCFATDRIHGHVTAENFDSIVRAIAAVHPTVVVNCIGIVKQATAANDPVMGIAINALFPHRLAQLCQAAGARLIHISTDCVFSGRQGHYTEDDTSDAEDLYGRTKYLGEVSDHGCLTLRTSMIGRELESASGLVEWFLSQQGRTVRGFRSAVFSGLTTQALSDVIAGVIAEYPELGGIWHVAAEPINKFDLLALVKQVYGLAIEIVPDDTFVCNRSLNGDRFREATGMVAPAWPVMIERMYQDPIPYEELRRNHARG